MTHYVTDWPLHCSTSFIPSSRGRNVLSRILPKRLFVFNLFYFTDHIQEGTELIFTLFKKEVWSNVAAGACVLSSCEF